MALPLIAVALDAASVIDVANRSSYYGQALEHPLVTETVEELAALVQGFHSLAAPYHIVVAPYRTRPDVQVGTVALHALLQGYMSQTVPLAEIPLVVILMASGGFSLVGQVLETSIAAVATVPAVVMAAAAEPLWTDLYSSSMPLVAVMTEKSRLHHGFRTDGMPSCATRSFPYQRDHLVTVSGLRGLLMRFDSKAEHLAVLVLYSIIQSFRHQV